MSSFDKVVKLACKPKPAPPKAKYLDPIIAATWSEDGAVHDVCKALVPRLREPNAIVVFKALIVLHTMIRNGATDNVLSHLSSSEVLRLRNVSAGNWEGYNAPQNMQHYALYLDSRIRAYRELKHDAIRVQSETNRDMRLNNSLEDDNSYTTAPPKASSTKSSKTPQRSKTIMGRKLRVMTVEKGLLRETKTVQKMIDSLVECRFYLDDLEDELTITALRMLVKDLLILFQAGNEGVINVLEHYFEMSKYDAEEALSIYSNFCAQTERVVEYLGVAKKLQNLLNVPIPNLKHAPVSLASSLQEYLNDPNFEQNRIEYKATKQAADRNAKDRSGAAQPAAPAVPSTSTTSAAAPSVMAHPSSSPTNASAKPDANQAMADFFSSIEEEQTSMFNPATGSPTSTQAVHNPFVQRQITGGISSQLYGVQLQTQATGFNLQQPFQPAQAFQPAPPQPVSTTFFSTQTQQAAQHRPFSTFVPSQPTGPQPTLAASFLQPQPTGGNPFRQSVLMPQSTGIGSFSASGIPPVPAVPAFPANSLFQLTSQQPQPPPQPLAPFMHLTQTSSSVVQNNISAETPARPASTPLTGSGSSQSASSPPIAQPVKSHQTGSRNPFGVPVTPAPPVPKPPTLLELSMGFGKLGLDGNQPSLQEAQVTAPAVTPHVQHNSIVSSEGTISSVASSFTFATKPEENPTHSVTHSLGSNLNGLSLSPLNSQMTSVTTTSASTTSSPFISSLSFQATGTTSISQSSSVPVPAMSVPLKAQPTGFGGVKPFKPTSNFGASLIESLPPMPESDGSSSNSASGLTASHSSAPSLPNNLTLNGSAFTSNLGGTINTQATGAPPSTQSVNGGYTPGIGLRPQGAGTLGAANPFRATMFAATSAPSTAGITSNSFMSSASTPQFGGLSNGSGTALPPFASGFGDSAFGLAFPHASQGTSNQIYQQQNAGTSLI